MRLENKTAIITGAGSGFGAGIARKFAAEGARVVVVDLNAEAARTVASKVGGTAVTADVATAEGIEAMTAAAMDAGGRIDILVNNAGVTHLPASMEEVSAQDFDRIFAVNCKSIYLAAQRIVPIMKDQKAGAIVNIASTAGVSPRPRLSWYNASKGWVITATRAMAVELAPFGIRVNALNPVAGETPLLASSWARTRPRCGPSSCPPSPSAAFPRPKIWATPPASSPRTRPR